MTDRETQIHDSVEALQEAAAEQIAEALAPSSLGQKMTIALSGGSTPRRMHEILASKPGIDWKNIYVFWGDERTVSPEHRESNYRMAHETLLKPAGVPEENVHRMPGELDPHEAADFYERRLHTVHKRSLDLPRLDIVLLGMGADGHTASLFPGTSALVVSDRLAVANVVPQLDTTRLTLTYPVLNNAGLVMFLVAGEDKAPAVVDTFAGITPAGLVRPHSGELRWILDAPAAAFLP